VTNQKQNTVNWLYDLFRVRFSPYHHVRFKLLFKTLKIMYLQIVYGLPHEDYGYPDLDDVISKHEKLLKSSIRLEILIKRKIII
jgi:hypothetical protein